MRFYSTKYVFLWSFRFLVNRVTTFYQYMSDLQDLLFIDFTHNRRLLKDNLTILIEYILFSSYITQCIHIGKWLVVLYEQFVHLNYAFSVTNRSCTGERS